MLVVLCSGCGHVSTAVIEANARVYWQSSFRNRQGGTRAVRAVRKQDSQSGERASLCHDGSTDGCGSLATGVPLFGTLSTIFPPSKGRIQDTHMRWPMYEVLNPHILVAAQAEALDYLEKASQGSSHMHQSIVT